MVSGLALVGNIEILAPHWFPFSGFSVHDDLGGEKNQPSVPISCQSKGTREMTK